MSYSARNGLQAFQRREAAKEAASAAERQRLRREQERQTIFTQPSAMLAEVCSSGEYKTSETQETLAVKIEDAFQEARRKLAAGGVTINDNAIPRFVAVAAVNTTLDFTKHQTWVSVYNHLESLGIWTDADRTVVQSEPVEPAKKLTLDDISLDTREGQRLGREIAFDEITDQWAVVFRAFTDSLYQNFSGFILTDQQRRTFYDTMIRRGMDLTKPKDYDRVRVALVKSGDLPSHLLYPAEILDRDMESADLSNRETRQEFARRSRQLSQR